MKNNIVSVLIKSLLIAIGTAGIISTAISAGFMGGGTTFLYFTVQSNITIILVTAVFLIDEILVIRGKQSFINQFWLHLKLAFTVAITLTCIVFVTLLAPITGLSYFLSFNNFSLHLIVPILAVIDFFVFDFKIKITKFTFLAGTIMPLYYLVFFLIGRIFDFKYLDGSIAPYFFLDYEKNGWFTINQDQLGVFYWILIMIAIVSIFGIVYSFLMTIRQKKTKLQ